MNNINAFILEWVRYWLSTFITSYISIYMHLYIFICIISKSCPLLYFLASKGNIFQFNPPANVMISIINKDNVKLILDCRYCIYYYKYCIVLSSISASTTGLCSTKQSWALYWLNKIWENKKLEDNCISLHVLFGTRILLMSHMCCGSEKVGTDYGATCCRWQSTVKSIQIRIVLSK